MINQPQLYPIRITWHSDVPSELRITLEPMLEKVLWLVPRWCEEFVVCFVSRPETDNAAALYNCEDYRWMRLYIYPAWMTSNDDARRYDLIHELVHASNGYVSDFCKRLIDVYVEDEKSGKVLRQELQSYIERATQDMASCIYAKIYGQLPRFSEIPNLHVQPPN